MSKPSWMTRLIPTFIGPQIPQSGFFLDHEKIAGIEHWSDHAVDLVARFAYTKSVRETAKKERERRK